MAKLEFTEPVNIRMDKETLKQFDKALEGRPRTRALRKLVRMFIKGDVVIDWATPEEEEVDFLRVI